ncbi:MAG: MATE family efflux transporter [Defluviitaleaceae bacterium]|nr:MATE family efflux transporter [Defluviitaleaceae bacterium]
MEHKDPSLEKNITPWFLLKFALPTIISMAGMGIFGVVDGIFAARFIDAYALSAVGLVSPFMMFALSIGFMLGIGGNAFVAKEIGEGNFAHARKDFTLISIAVVVLSVALSAIGLIFPEVILNILGVDAEIFDISRTYLITILPFVPLGVLGNAFQQFMITEGKAHISMISTVVSGLVGVLLNYVFIYQMGMGLQGAGLSTGIGYALPAITGFVFFIYNRFNKNGILYFVIPKLKLFVLGKAATNGLSEMVTMMSASITATVMNNVLMDLDGPMAVAAVGVIGAVQGLAANIYIGYSSGIAPIISYNYGKRDFDKVKRIVRISLIIVSSLAITLGVLAFAFPHLLISIYDIDPVIYFDGFIMSLPIYDMAFTGIRLVAFGFVFMAINNFISIMFTSLNDGRISGVIALFNGFIFTITFILLFSHLWGVTGVFVSLPAQDAATLLIAGYMFFRFRKKFNYA